MANTFTLISSITATNSSTTAYTFSSIPSIYTDLKVLCSLRDTATGASWVEFDIGYNGGTTSGSWRAVFGTGSTASSTVSTTESYAGEQTTSSNTANTFSNVEIYIPNYNNTNSVKYFSSDSAGENNATASIILLNAGSMNGSSAGITSLTFTAKGTAFSQYSTFYLYGIKNS